MGNMFLTTSPIWSTALATAVSVAVTLIVTLLFNKLIGLPKKWKDQKEADRVRWETLKTENEKRDAKIANIQTSVDALPIYRAQSKQIQEQLQLTDKAILETCTKIQEGVELNRQLLETRLNRLENREKNALRAKILNEYRLFTDAEVNPMLAWSEMEHHAFFELVKDYESLGGNDYVHSVVLPAMNELDVISMSNTKKLEELYHSRHSK